MRWKKFGRLWKRRGMSEELQAFYTRLLATPLRDRPGYIWGLGYQRIALPRTRFVRALSAANAVLTRRVI
jgi:hypothetical protein